MHPTAESDRLKAARERNAARLQGFGDRLRSRPALARHGPQIGRPRWTSRHLGADPLVQRRGDFLESEGTYVELRTLESSRQAWLNGPAQHGHPGSVRENKN